MDLAQAIQFLNCSARQGVAVHLLAAHLGIAGMQVEAVAAGNDRKGLLEVAAQLVGRAGLAGVIAGDGEAAAQLLAGVLEAADVVALPAMDGDRDARQLFEGFIGVHAQGGIAFFGKLIGLFDLLGGAHVRSQALVDLPLGGIVATAPRWGNRQLRNGATGARTFLSARLRPRAPARTKCPRSIPEPSCNTPRSLTVTSPYP